MPIDKKSLREEVLTRRAALTQEERINKSYKISELLLNTSEFQEAKTVMSFLNFRDEVETTGIAQKVLELGKPLVLPRCAPKGILIPALIHNLEEDIEPGVWGIREPKKANLQPVDPLDIDCIIVPGAAFDAQGYRLGYGGGYYDRFFERLPIATPKIALAFSCQIVLKVPVEPFDKKVDMLITEEGITRFLSG